MHKTLILILSLLLLSGVTKAQVSWWGVKGGLNISTIGTQASGFTTRLGYHAGIYASKQFFQELGIQADLMVSYQGARSSDINDFKLNYTYLTLPVMVNIYATEFVAFELGLQPGYLLRAVQAESDDKLDISDSVRDFDFAGIIGVGYKHPVIEAGLRYVLGIINTNSSNISSDVYTGNLVLQIYVAKPLGSKQN